MKNLTTTFGTRAAYVIACLAILLGISTASFAQTRPDLGTAATYAVFTSAGSITVTTGDTAVLGGGAGYNTGSLEGFPPSTATFINEANSATAIAASNLLTAYTANCLTCGTVLGTTITNVTLVPGDYSTGAASTTGGNITFNAQGDSAAIFIVNIGSGNGTGSLTVASGTHMLLENNARPGNIYWFVGGAVTIHDSATFIGTIVAGGAIIFLGQSTLTGRALTTAGAINLADNHMSISNDTGGANEDSLTVIIPFSGDSILSGTLRDTIKWTGTGIALGKTIQYSLDSGLTWTTISTISNDSFVYLWNVPDTTSTKAEVRVTDSNNLRGVSGVFKIISNKLIVVNPAAGVLITEGTLHDTITWSGTGLTATKTFAYSLDSGLTWITIGKDTTNGFTYIWSVPDTTSTKAMIRITDSNGVTGKSGIFTIGSNKIVVTSPTLGEKIAEGTQDFQVTWTGTSITAQKTLSLSLDGGLTWTTIGTITANVLSYYWDVPDTTSTEAIIRITDTNGLTGQSGIFSIQSNKVIVVVNPARGVVIASGSQNYQITWTGTGLTAPETLQLSLDGGGTWSTIGTVSNGAFTYSWNVPDSTSTDAIIRITDADGITGESGIFSIKPNVGSIVVIDPAAGAVISGGTVNYQITFTATGNVTEEKTLEYSLDGGETWTLIGVMNSDAESYSWDEVPNTATTQALIRIQDSNGVTGISGLFTITVAPNVGSINSVILSGLDANRNIGNNQTLEITWTFTPDIGTSVDVEYSLDYLATWNLIATVPVTGDGGPESPNSTTWQTTASGYYNPVFIRVISSDSMKRLAAAFSIGSLASVAPDAATSGYSVSNYPNPASEQTTINFELPVQSEVTLIVSDNLGRQISETSQAFDAGEHNIPFNTSQLADGVYTYTLVAGSIRLNGRMSVVR